MSNSILKLVGNRNILLLLASCTKTRPGRPIPIASVALALVCQKCAYRAGSQVSRGASRRRCLGATQCFVRLTPYAWRMFYRAFREVFNFLLLYCNKYSVGLVCVEINFHILLTPTGQWVSPVIDSNQATRALMATATTGFQPVVVPWEIVSVVARAAPMNRTKFHNNLLL